MLAFVDESGDAGLKIDRGSSRYLVIAMVVFEDHEEAQAADDRISQLRQEMGFSERCEFKFHGSSRENRVRFLESLAPYKFSYYGIVINKDTKKLYGSGFNYKDSFYKYASKLLFTNAKKVLKEAIVVVDGSGGREFKAQFGKYLKLNINDEDQRYIRKIKLRNSVGNNLIQLADMVSGAIYRSFSDKPDAQTYRSIIKKKHEAKVQLWPK